MTGRLVEHITIGARAENNNDNNNNNSRHSACRFYSFNRTNKHTLKLKH